MGFDAVARSRCVETTRLASGGRPREWGAEVSRSLPRGSWTVPEAKRSRVARGH